MACVLNKGNQNQKKMKLPADLLLALAPLYFLETFLLKEVERWLQRQDFNLPQSFPRMQMGCRGDFCPALSGAEAHRDPGSVSSCAV